MVNHSTEPNKYPSINHEILDRGIRSGQIDPNNYMGTVPLSEVPAYTEDLEKKVKILKREPRECKCVVRQPIQCGVCGGKI